MASPRAPRRRDGREGSQPGLDRGLWRCSSAVFSGPEGVVFSTQARPGTIWTRVVRTSRGLVIHLINLVGQDELEWDAGKNDPAPQPGIKLRLAPVGEPPVLIWATPDADNGGPRTLSGLAEGAGNQSDALSGGQVHAVYDLPIVRTWALIFIANSDLAAVGPRGTTGGTRPFQSRLGVVES